jgi:hypothetical protein
MMQLRSSAFENTDRIPARFTCKGEDISPDLKWTGVPDDTQSLALIFDDPDAPMGTWVHWVLYNLRSERDGLPEDVDPEGINLSDGGVQGTNSWGRTGYGGPCPPSGTHRYYFRLYALDTILDLGPGATRNQLTRAMEGHVLAEAELMGRFSK